MDYVKWFRGIEDYDELIAVIDREENPLGVMCVCCRAYFYSVLKGRKEFKSSDFI
ncbi:MAG: hypothetical protein K5765_06085 [Clostridia bacterium]|nr:hypothetical protein [Clostridia bacterium]